MLSFVVLQGAVFSDSKLCPLITCHIQCPLNWYVNCTPGGQFRDITKEVKSPRVRPEIEVILAWTNILNDSLDMRKAEEQLNNLLITAKEEFNEAKVFKSSIHKCLRQQEKSQKYFNLSPCN